MLKKGAPGVLGTWRILTSRHICASIEITTLLWNWQAPRQEILQVWFIFQSCRILQKLAIRRFVALIPRPFIFTSLHREKYRNSWQFFEKYNKQISSMNYLEASSSSSLTLAAISMFCFKFKIFVCYMHQQECHCIADWWKIIVLAFIALQFLSYIWVYTSIPYNWSRLNLIRFVISPAEWVSN